MSSNSDAPLKLIPSKPESEIAADLIRRARQALVPCLAIMEEAIREGLMIHWALGVNQFGKGVIQDIYVDRQFRDDGR